MVGKIIALAVGYFFIGSLTFRVMEHLDIGVWHNKYDHNDKDRFGPFLGALFWPVVVPCLMLHSATKSLFHLLVGGKDGL